MSPIAMSSVQLRALADEATSAAETRRERNRDLDALSDALINASEVGQFVDIAKSCVANIRGLGADSDDALVRALTYSGEPGGHSSQYRIAVLTLVDIFLARINAGNRQTLDRTVSGNCEWRLEVCNSVNGAKLVIRRVRLVENMNGIPSPVMD